jgi:hypothetical protein
MIENVPNRSTVKEDKDGVVDGDNKTRLTIKPLRTVGMRILDFGFWPNRLTWQVGNQHNTHFPLQSRPRNQSDQLMYQILRRGKFQLREYSIVLKVSRIPITIRPTIRQIFHARNLFKHET